MTATTPNFVNADPEMLSHVAAFRERGATTPHPDCSWCDDAALRGLWDTPLRRYRVTFYLEAEVEVNALTSGSAKERAWLATEPEIVDSYVVDVGAAAAAKAGDWQPAVNAYFREREMDDNSEGQI